MLWNKRIVVGWRCVSRFNSNTRVARLGLSTPASPRNRQWSSCTEDFSDEAIEREEKQKLEKKEVETHFSILNVEPKFDLDVHLLEKRFKELQRMYHPDKFVNASQNEQDKAHALSSRFNHAYEVLKKPHLRARYMLELAGEKVSQVEVDPQFLMDVLETMERVEGSDKPMPQKELRELHKSVFQKEQEAEQQLVKFFRNKEYAQARNVVAHMNYYVRILDSIYQQLDIKE